MAHSVIITTPMPTWEETVELYGLSKADQKFVASLFDKKTPRRSTSYAFKRPTVSLDTPKNVTKKSSSMARKPKSRARKAA